MLNILFILPEYYPHSGGGISTFYLQYIQNLKPKIGNVKVIIGSGYTQGEMVDIIDGVEIEYLKPALFQKYMISFGKLILFPEYKRNIASAWAMWEQCDCGKGFDLVECVDFGLGFVPWICKQTLPVVTRLHGSTGQINLYENSADHLNGDFHRQAEQGLLAASNGLITHSRANQEFWKNIFPWKNVELIYPIYQIASGDLIASSEKNKDGIVCGRIQEWKGPDILCQALAKMPDSNFRINWYGRDTMYKDGISKSTQLKKDFPEVWGEKILPRPSLSNAELINIMCKSKYAIVPSTWDMFNFTVLEYMSVGTPVICSNGAGASELIEDGVNGFTYDKNDPVNLGECLVAMNSLTSEAYNRLVENAKSCINNKLDPDIIINQNLDVYQKLTKNFVVNSINPFDYKNYFPDKDIQSIGHILDNQPLKGLVNYTFKRLVKRLTKK